MITRFNVLYHRLSKKPLLFGSFAGLEVSEFDSVYKQIESKYKKYEIIRLSKRKNRRRKIGAANHFKLHAREDFSCFWVTTDCT
jgi:hypothetical protein